MAVAFSAPITAMTGNLPVAVGFGNGSGAPAAFIFATVVLTIFSIGYVAMARHITTAGAFYGFVSHGIGRPVGMADINVAARVLAVLLLTEISILAITAFGVLFSGGGPDGIPLSPINPANAFSGNGVAEPVIGLGLLMAFWSWVGFESTAITARSRATRRRSCRARRSSRSSASASSTRSSRG